MSVICDDLRGLWEVLQPNKYQYGLLILQVILIGGTFGLTFFPLGFVGGPDEEDEFYVGLYMISHAHIFTYGITKAVSNLFAGLLSDTFGRKIPHIVGWIIGLITPIMIIFAPNWNTVVASMLFLGLQQALTWSTDLFCMIDYAGPKHRGIAIGLNETCGYCAIATFNVIAAFLMESDPNGKYRTNPYYLCIAMMILGLVIAFFLKETLHSMIKMESENENDIKLQRIKTNEIDIDNENENENEDNEPIVNEISKFQVFLNTSFLKGRLVACSQAGLMTNFIVGLAWTFLVKWMKNDFDSTTISGTLLGFGIIRGLSQFFTGYAGDLFGRKWIIFSGLMLNAIILFIFCGAISSTEGNTKLTLFTFGAIIMGFGIGLVYPNLLAVVAEETDSHVRATALGTYRLWRDLGYAIGAIISGGLIDATGSFDVAIGIVASATTLSAIMFLLLYTKGESKSNNENNKEITSNSNITSISDQVDNDDKTALNIETR
eukprot:495664_1